MIDYAGEALGGEGDTHSPRVLSFFVGMIVLFLLLMFRFVQLQVIDYDDYALRSESNRVIERPIEPIRGAILDREGVPLASTRLSWTLSIVREQVPDLDALLSTLQSKLGLTPRELENFQRGLRENRRPYEPVALKFDLTLEQRAMVSVDRYHLPGVRIEARNLRDYPLKGLFAHAVGSVRRISVEDYADLDHTNYRGAKYIGKLGLERHYETLLRGRLGQETLEVRASGRVTRTINAVAPVKGEDLYTELSVALHETAEQALAGRRGAVVAIDPRDGAIRALVSTPNYDPNLFVTGLSTQQFADISKDPQGPLFNRAVAGLYSPGSTVKPMIGLSALAHGLTDWERTIEDPGWFRLPGSSHLYRDWTWRPGGYGGHGTVDLYRAIYRSANVYFFELASRLEPAHMTDSLARFGFGEDLSLDVSNAALGLVPTPEWKLVKRNDSWRVGDNLNMAIGQGSLLASPIQVATAAAILARRGRIVRPFLYRRALQQSGFEPGTVAPPVTPSQEDHEQIVRAMEAVVHRGNMGPGGNGTAWAYIGLDIPYRMAGKSGTAQVIRQQQDEYVSSEDVPPENRNHAWFMAFAPVDAPSIAVAVLIEHGGSGSSSAAPVARAVIDAWMHQQAAR